MEFNWIESTEYKNDEEMKTDTSLDALPVSEKI